MTPPPAAAAAAPSVRPRRPVAPRGPRRVSGPARPAQPARSRQRAVGSDALGLFSALESLAQHRLLDRLIRGRTWIAIVAFALIGIVTLQLGLLKLNGGIGRALEHEAVLQRQNATLSIENSELASGSRVESQAAHLGMSFVPAGALRFLTSSSRGDVGKAASALSTAPAAAASSTAQAGAQSSEAGESTSGSEASTAAQSPSAAGESPAEGETSGAASSTTSSESASGTESGTSETTAPASSESESTASAAAQTGAGGGIEATSSGE